MPGLFLVVAGTMAFFAHFSLPVAENICLEKNGSPVITKECYIEALEPIESANHDNYNE